MKKISGLIIPVLLFLFLLMPSKEALSEERSIYPGDLISLEISNLIITEDDLRAKFTDFEIVDFVAEKNGYLITVRSFEPGVKKILLGNDELVIEVKSILEDINREGVYEGNQEPIKAGFTMQWNYLLFLLILIFLISGSLCVIKSIHKRNPANLSPFAQFQKQTDRILLSENTCFAYMTQSLKQYLEACFSCNIRGKTSSEILEELRLVQTLQPYLAALETWLKECDRYKYANAAAAVEDKQGLLNNLNALVISMEKGVEA